MMHVIKTRCNPLEKLPLLSCHCCRHRANSCTYRACVDWMRLDSRSAVF